MIFEPVFKISEDGYLLYSSDNGCTWKIIGPVRGSDGEGIQGPEGPEGPAGADGKDGKDGEDGQDGQDGRDGTDGINGATPLLKIVEGYLYASYDNWTTQSQLGKVQGEQGEMGLQGFTPYIDSETKHWFINNEDTGIVAQGLDGQSIAYEAGTGITIDDDTINANTGATTTAAITCSTGAPVNALSVYPNGIPQGTSVQEILEKLLCKEIFPNAATKPTISLSGNSALGVREIGTTVTIPVISMTKDNGNFNPASYGSLNQHSVGTVTWSDEEITVTKNSGFTGNQQADGTTSVASSSGTVILGENKVTYNGSATYSGPSNMPITNLNHETQSTSQISTDGSDLSATWGDDGEATATAKTTTATGAYPCFINLDTDEESATYGELVGTIDNTSEKIIPTRGSYTNSTLTKIYLKNIPGETSSIRFKFAFPAGRNVTFYGPDTTETGYAVINSNTYEVTEVANFYGSKTYKVLTASKGLAYYSSGITRCYFELSKGLDKEQ